ncbi:MAG: class E sortase [Acidimicrobiales bacterium]
MGDVSIRRNRARRRGSLSWLWPALVVAGATVGGLAGLDDIGRPADPPLLRASFIGAPAPPEVRLAAAAPATPPAPAPPAARPGAIDVPSDPYAAEAVVEIGSLEIARLGVRQRLMNGVTLRNIDFGPSHWPGTAMPGEAGNMVVAGHRVTHSRPFRNIDQLVAGDQIVVTANGQRATYQVASSFVVTPDRTDIANPTPTPTLTLFACHPPGSARQRFVVRADLISSSAV